MRAASNPKICSIRGVCMAQFDRGMRADEQQLEAFVRKIERQIRSGGGVLESLDSVAWAAEAHVTAHDID